MFKEKSDNFRDIAHEMLLQVPRASPRAFSSARPSSYMLRRQTWILNQMRYISRNPIGDLSKLRPE